MVGAAEIEVPAVGARRAGVAAGTVGGSRGRATRDGGGEREKAGGESAQWTSVGNPNAKGPGQEA